MINIEYKLFYLINKGCINPVFDLIMPVITAFGSGDFIFALAIILLFVDRKKKDRPAGIMLLAGLTTGHYVVSFLKEWIARPRPPFVLVDVHVVGKLAKSFSFPSGHTAIAFMAAAILSRYYRHPVIFFALASLVAFSRVYLGVHYVTDVISGAALGSMIGYVLTRIIKEK